MFYDKLNALLFQLILIMRSHSSSHQYVSWASAEIFETNLKPANEIEFIHLLI